MKIVQKLEFYTGSKEEYLPDMTADFPYTMSCAQLDQYPGRFVPWHWHKAVELFYMESGALEYSTPKGKRQFPSGTGGFVNSNVLHMTKTLIHREKNIQFLHIFEPSFISGGQGSRIEKKYVMPLVTATQVELLALSQEEPSQKKVLKRMREAFAISEQEAGYEIKLRGALSDIWLMLLELCSDQLEENKRCDKHDERLKTMIIYIQEHFSDKIPVSELAARAYLSERECFRLFQTYLHTTPAEYIRNCRLQEACRMLADGKGSVTEIGRACGLGSSSYFGRIFREYTGCTPVEYRRKWQDRNI